VYDKIRSIESLAKERLVHTGQSPDENAGEQNEIRSQEKWK